MTYRVKIMIEGTYFYSEPMDSREAWEVIEDVERRNLLVIGLERFDGSHWVVV